MCEQFRSGREVCETSAQSALRQQDRWVQSGGGITLGIVSEPLLVCDCEGQAETWSLHGLGCLKMTLWSVVDIVKKNMKEEDQL